jgi:arylsulfatase A-like enzyme/Flp pilus assembly protein TadD
VLFVTLDTFRADRAGCYGHPGGLTPALDRVFRRALQVESAYAPAPLTAPSHASLLTGLEPPRHGVRDNGAYSLGGDVPTLPSVLRAHGFRTGAFVAAFPLERRFGFANGFERFDDDLEPAASPTLYARRPAAAVVDAALAWIGSLPPGDRWFAWTHFFDPHHPPHVPPPLRELPARDDYDRSLRGLDREVGRLLRAIEERGRVPIVAIASDHGEALGGHGESSHGLLLYEETTRALFAVAAPATPPSLRTSVVRHADLAPTLLDVLGLDAPAEIDGRSLARAEAPDAGAYGEAWSPAFKYGWSPLLAFRDDRWTYIEGPDPELYDRRADPAETRNVRDDHPEVVARLSREIARIAKEPDAPSEGLLDEEARSKLLALGYLGGGGAPTFRSGKDPKALVTSATWLFRGIHLVLSDRAPEEALPYLQRAYRADPENPMAVHYLAYCLQRLGDATSAMSYYRRAIELNPRGAEAWAHLAVLEFDRGRREEAFAILDEGFAVNPGSFPLLMTAGDLRLDAGDPEAADSLWRAAAEAEAKRPEPWVRRAGLAEHRGDASAARELWAAALERDPNHPMIPARVR